MSPHLEVLHAPARGAPRPVDLLFVHGICVGAWIWERHFLPAFAAAGYNAYAISLRGHGGSDGHERLHSFGLDDYAADVSRVATGLGRPVVVVGHSMGGAVVQNAIARGVRFEGAVLMASVSPYGLLPASVSMMARTPLLWREAATTALAGLPEADPAVMRDGLFADRISVAEYDAFAERVHGESMRVGLEVQGCRPFAPLPWFAPPMLVMGGDEDRFVGVSDLWLTAAWYGTVPYVLPGLSHIMMMDPDWRHAADRLLAWLERSGVGRLGH